MLIQYARKGFVNPEHIVRVWCDNYRWYFTSTGDETPRVIHEQFVKDFHTHLNINPNQPREKNNTPTKDLPEEHPASQTALTEVRRRLEREIAESNGA